MTSHLVTHDLPQVDRYLQPFDRRVSGFNDGWWGRHVPNKGARYDTRFLSFTKGGREVARAYVDAQCILHASYIGLKTPARVIEVVFFEVREGYRGEGVGRLAVSEIAALFPAQQLIAFVEQSEWFWSGIGWKRHLRTDSDKNFRPLFAIRT